MIAFAVLMTFMFGGMMLALVMGYAETERTRQKESQQSTDGVARAVESVPRFFAPLDAPVQAASLSGNHDEFVDHLEGYLKAEQALVARFVNEPTVDNLYRQTAISLSVN
jgi:hypothetical protein